MLSAQQLSADLLLSCIRPTTIGARTPGPGLPVIPDQSRVSGRRWQRRSLNRNVHALPSGVACFREARRLQARLAASLVALA